MLYRHIQHHIPQLRLERKERCHVTRSAIVDREPTHSVPLDDPAGELQVGDYITVWSPDGGGLGGVVQNVLLDCEPYRVELLSGTARIERTLEITGPNVDRVERHQFMDADECINRSEDCKGPVDWAGAPGGGSFPRCDYHAEKRWANQSELERYADSDVAPNWFDPADAGEHWDDQY